MRFSWPATELRIPRCAQDDNRAESSGKHLGATKRTATGLLSAQASPDLVDLQGGMGPVELRADRA
jgi:hypothetical protein